MLLDKVFSAAVPVAFRNVEIHLNRFLDSSGATTTLLSETSYQATTSSKTQQDSCDGVSVRQIYDK